jgi:hypothetical protein
MTDDSRSFWAWLVLTVGALIVLLCGPCTLMFGGGALISLARGEDSQLAGMILVIALVIGALPTAGGVVLVLNGLESLRKLRRGRDPN